MNKRFTRNSSVFSSLGLLLGLWLENSIFMEYDYDYLFKVIVVGDKRVGKSSLIKRFREDSFQESSLPPTIGIDFLVKDVEIGSSRVKVRRSLYRFYISLYACFLFNSPASLLLSQLETVNTFSAVLFICNFPVERVSLCSLQIIALKSVCRLHYCSKIFPCYLREFRFVLYR